MQRINLNGAWRFKGINKYRTLPANNRGITEWMNAAVPGTVHTDLLANRAIPDPFYRMNELDVQWVDSQQWVYRKPFVVDEHFLSAREVELVAEGLDTYARIRINGKGVAETANMFVEHRLSVKQFLRRGTNVIEIMFDSPVARSKKLQKKYGKLDVALEPHRVYVRKAQYSFGWDWGPRLATSGIWRNIFLEASSHPILRHPFVKVVSANKREAVIELSVEIHSTANVPLKLRTVVTGENCVVTNARTARVKGTTFRLTIPNPKLWWPNGHGEQPLYTAAFTLLRDGTEIHALQTPFAVRTVRLLQEQDAEGESFVIEVNGAKIFCKGADWIPSDSFLPRIANTTYEKLLAMARDAHMNMIRVWGGGCYEQDVFYNLCDKLGLMVWQDFMFACGEYPEQPWFLRQVEKEATKVVKRLRNHPSIVLWCGNNECEWIFCAGNPGKGPDDMSGATIFRDLLPEAVRKFDGTRPYWRSSPFGKGSPNDESNGNHHQWLVWSSWKDYKEYENDNARFVTEFGFQAPANSRTYDSVTRLSDRHMQSQVIEYHNKQVEGTERLFRFQGAHFQLGTNFGDFIYKGQLVQAEALKTAVEHWRRRKFKTAGALFWQLNDCWPVSSWAVIDSALRPKAAYYYSRKFFAPVLVSFKTVGGRIEVWGTNDLLLPVDATLEATLNSFTGKTIWSRSKRARLAANSSKVLGAIISSEYVDEDLSTCYLLARLRSEVGLISENRFFFLEPKHLNLPKAKVQTDLKRIEEGKFELTVRADKFLKYVFVEIEGEEPMFEDNYFDLDARESKRLVFDSRRPMNNLRKRLKFTWL